MNNRNVVFNGVNLESITGVRVTEINTSSTPTRQLNQYDLANADGLVISGEYYKTKRIPIKGYIALSSKELLEDAIAQLHEILDGVEALLVLPKGSDLLEYTATSETLILSNTTGGFTEFEIPFICSDPRGYKSSRTTILDVAALTSENQSYVVTTEGTGTQLPLITITVDAISGGAADVTFGNLTRGESMNISRTWEVGDILIVNAETGSVTVNGTNTDFSGAIPILNKGSNTLYYDDNFTSRSVDIIVSYRKRYL